MGHVNVRLHCVMKLMLRYGWGWGWVGWGGACQRALALAS